MDLPIRLRTETQQPQNTKTKKKGGKKIQAAWEQYFGTDDDNLQKWQQLGRDLGIPEEKLASKAQIRKALKGVWVNIHDFLYQAKNKPEDVIFFESERQLAEYTMSAGKIFPRKNISKGSPLRILLAQILNPRWGGKSRK